MQTHKGNEKWPLFVNKQLFWWSASITLDNNNAVLTDLSTYFSLNTLPHTSVSLTRCISIVFFSFEYFDPYVHYAVCWVTLKRFFWQRVPHNPLFVFQILGLSLIVIILWLFEKYTLVNVTTLVTTL